MSNTSLLGSYGGLGNSGLQFRNKIINGGFDIWQRGTTGVPAGAPGSYVSVDRWKIATIDSGISTATASLTQVTTDLPAGFQYAAKLAATSANTDTMRVFQYIESANCFDLVGKKVTISAKIKRLNTLNSPILVQLFYLNTKDTGSTNAVFSQIADSTAIGSLAYTPTTSDWETVTFTTDSVLPDGAKNGLIVSFYYGESNMGANDKFAITGVQLEAGPVATPFEHRPVGLELSLCQRYYEKSYDLDTAPGTNTSSGCCRSMTVTTSSGVGLVFAPFKVTKRANPANTAYTQTGTAGSILFRVNEASAVTNTASDAGEGGVISAAFFRTGLTANARFYTEFHWTADAEL